jgi:hypothetical protein
MHNRNGFCKKVGYPVKGSFIVGGVTLHERIVGTMNGNACTRRGSYSRISWFAKLKALYFEYLRFLTYQSLLPGKYGCLCTINPVYLTQNIAHMNFDGLLTNH